MPTVETLEITCRRGEDGNFGIPIEDRGGDAWVGEQLQGMAMLSSLHAGDRITLIDGRKFGRGFNRARMALIAAGNEVILTVVRGETPPPARTRPLIGTTLGSTLGACSVAMMLLAISWRAIIDLPPANEVLARGSGARASAARALVDPPPASKVLARGGGVVASSASSVSGRMTIIANGRTFSIRDDGSADEPELLCAALRSDSAMMEKIRLNEPEWAALITSASDGPFDVAQFQRIMRKNYANYQVSSALKMHEDGSAVEPTAFLRNMRQQKEWQQWLTAAHGEVDARQVLARTKPTRTPSL